MATLDGAVRSAGVTSEARLMTAAAVRGNYIQEILNGWAFIGREDSVTPTGADDCFLVVENNSNDPLVITDIHLTDAGAENLVFEVGPAYTLATTHAAIDSCTNRLVGSTNLYSAKATVETGVDITGLAASTQIATIAVGAATRALLNETSNPEVFPIILGNEQALSVFAATGTTAITELNVCYYHVMTPNTDSEASV